LQKVKPVHLPLTQKWACEDSAPDTPGASLFRSQALLVLNSKALPSAKPAGEQSPFESPLTVAYYKV
jgi:hypothetical protein